jgi:hypothetical protein
MRVGHYEPNVDDTITVELPDERTRAKIIGVVSDTAVTVELLTFTTNNKSHPYKKGDKVPAMFVPGPMNRHIWKVISDAELEALLREERAVAEAAQAEENRAPPEVVAPPRQMVDGDL